MRTYRPVIAIPLAPGAAMMPAALLIALLAASTARSQADPRCVAADAAFAEQRVVQQANEATGLLYKRLPLEVEFVAAACGLNEEQVAALHEDGRSAIDRLTEEAELSRPPRLAEGEEIMVAKVPVAGDDALRKYDAAFDDEQSCFHKALKGRLSDEQKQKLAAANAQRRALQRQALVAATVAGFERTASLTSRQWERLSAALTTLIALDDLWIWLEGRQRGGSEDVDRIGQWPEEWWRPFFFDFQWWPARQHHEQWINMVRQCKMRQRQDGAAPARLPGAAVRIMGEGTF